MCDMVLQDPEVVKLSFRWKGQSWMRIHSCSISARSGCGMVGSLSNEYLKNWIMDRGMVSNQVILM